MKTKTTTNLILTGLILFIFVANLPAQLVFNEAYDQPVLGYGDPGEWDDAVVWNPAIIKEGDTLHMWYTGHDQDVFTHSLIGYAWSLDGISWNKYANNPVLVNDLNWEGNEIYGCAVIKDTDTLKMWYGASMQKIGYAWSLDGINWNKHPEPLVEMGPELEWDEGVIVPSTVIKEGNEYKMWYWAGRPGFPGEDSHTQVGLANSLDGINWTKYDDPSTIDAPFAYSDPALKVGQEGEWDSNRIDLHTVLKIESGYIIMYSGIKAPFYSSMKGHAGIAYSSDGINWVKDEDNPILMDDHSFVTWGDGIGSGKLLYYNDQFHFWFSCFSNPAFTARPQIGYATGVWVGLDENHKDSYQCINYPNPFTSTTIIEYEIISQGIVIITIYNNMGEQIERIEEKQSQGIQQMVLNAEGLPAGIYFCVLKTDKGIKTTKMIKF